MTLTFAVSFAENGALLRNFLRAHGVSASLARSVKTHGGFWCGGAPIHTDMRVSAGTDIVFALPPERDTTVLPQEMPFCAVYEDMHALVLNKPAGLTVHPTRGYPDGTLANAFCGEMLRRGAPRAFRPIHRIDRNTSGLVLCAMNEYAAPLLGKSVQKTYYAVVQGSLPDSGEIDAPIGLCAESFIKHCVTPDGKPSVTRYRTLWRGDGLSLAAVTPVTGRTHQIRVHFAALGYPLAGDDFYGGMTDKICRHALHCGRVTFEDVRTQYGAQTGETVTESAACAPARHTVLCPLPADMAALLPPKVCACLDAPARGLTMD
ncbi:MAG: RluA family pseudouridine synthase [Ruthenibacterium sp.]